MLVKFFILYFLIIALLGKYVPPHLRDKALFDSKLECDKAKEEQLIRLRRQLQGLLNRFYYNIFFLISVILSLIIVCENRLSGSNIESIIINIEELYQKFTRHGK